MAVGEANSIDRQSRYRKPPTEQFSVATNGRFTVAPNIGLQGAGTHAPTAAGRRIAVHLIRTQVDCSPCFKTQEWSHRGNPV